MICKSRGGLLAHKGEITNFISNDYVWCINLYLILLCCYLLLKKIVFFVYLQETIIKTETLLFFYFGHF